MDILSQVPWGDIGPSGLLAIAVLAIIQGWLVPRRTYDALAQDRDYWRDAAMENARQVAELTEVSKSAVAALDALPSRKEGG